MTDTADQIQGLLAAAFVDMKAVLCLGLMVSLIITLAFVLVLANRTSWSDFSISHKWSCRVFLLTLSLFIAVPILFLPANGVSSLMPGKIAMESPSLTATAIKLGLYGLYQNYEISRQLPREKRDLVTCISAVSLNEAYKIRDKCNDDQACYTNIPVMTRNIIFEKIKEASSVPSSAAYKACKGVDVSKIY